jgi:bifunctional oligoribonuclease and PAP phosphatase NrnA
MNIESSAAEIEKLISGSNKIVVIQADNPDADSLSSSLALEHILGDLGKEVSLFCGVDLPSYLMYLPGSDRVVSELPKDFDLSIIVDTSSDTLLEQLARSGQKGWIAAKPSIIIDHHVSEKTISFATTTLNYPAVATTEIIYELAKILNWPINSEAKEFIAIAILSDSLGLTSESTSARSIHIIGELVEAGVSIAKIDSARRETMKRETELVHYKGKLLQRVQFFMQDTIAVVSIPWAEIEKYSPLYNPSMLVLDDMRLAKNVKIAIAFKVYNDKRVTAKIRANYGWGVADKIAEHFGGGGHPYASGFKIINGASYETIKNETIEISDKLLKELNQ